MKNTYISTDITYKVNAVQFVGNFIYIYTMIRLHLSISTALMRPRRPKQYCLQLDIALWCKNQIEHSIWDESLLLCNCACSLEYFSLSTLAGLSYHICGKLEVAFKASPSF